MSRYLNTIAKNIEDDRCIVLLGPEVSLTPKGIPFHEDLFRYLQEETDLKIDRDIEGLIVFKDKFSEIDFFYELEKYYEDHSKPTDLHLQLAEIPCHLFITITPDLMLKNAFEEKGLAYNFHVYNKDETTQDVPRPSKDAPLIYNLFGSIEQENSLVNTSGDLFDYVFSLLSGSQRLPRMLLSTIQSAKIFVFLGFDFDKWYMKLILRLLNMHGAAIPLASEAGNGMDDKTKAFFIHNFEMQFIDTDIPSLVTGIYQDFSKNGTIRQVSKDSQKETKKAKPKQTATTPDQIVALIKQGDIPAVLELMDTYLTQISQNKEEEDKEESAEELLNEVILQSGKYNLLQKQIDQGTISKDDSDLQLNKLLAGLLNLANEIKDI